MTSKKIAVCIPTWKRPSYIEKVLQAEGLLLIEYDIDMYIYDSSSDSDTLSVVERYQNNFHIFYRRIDESIHSNEKYYMICEDMQQSDYDYLWIMQDHMIFSEKACEHLVNELDCQVDFIYLNISGSVYTSNFEMDLHKFAINCAWLLTRYGIAIMNVKTFLNGIDWEKMRQKWLSPLTINNSHVGLYFDRLAVMNTPRILNISFQRDQLYDFARSKPLSWDKELFRICLECWGNTIENLSDFYSADKLQIMQNQDGLFFSATKLLQMRKTGDYGLKQFAVFEKWINKIYPQKYQMFKDIAIETVEFAEKKYLGEIIDKIINVKTIGASVYLYGAGRHAADFAEYLMESRLSFDGFIVSKKSGNPDDMCEHKVWGIEEIGKNKQDMIIVTVARESIPSAIETIKACGYTNNEIIILGDNL